MADEDTPMRTEEEDDEESGSGSGSDSSSSEEQVEWLATTRAKRTTAGNRLASLLQAEETAEQEEPDDDLELLFVETEDDVGFDINAAQDDSDVQMDSSSDEDDQGPAAGAEDLDGEKALQKAERAERIAKKRKLGIPGMVKRKKVKIDPTTISQKVAAPRPKKKSERASWLPTAEDAPTRASSRKSSKLSKEQLHQQMVEREFKRLKQLANMEKIQARKEAAKKPALTQEDRLKEAARVEKSNAKSLSRWEQAENLREQMEKEKLAALHNRAMDGPVITTWSGMATYVGGKLRKLGTNVTIEEKEKPSKKRKAAEMEAEETEKAKSEGSKPAEGASTGKPDESTNSGAAKEGISGSGKPEGSAKPEEIPLLGGKSSESAKDGNPTSGPEKDGKSVSPPPKPDDALSTSTIATPKATEANGHSKPNDTPATSTSKEATPSEVPKSRESEKPGTPRPNGTSLDERPPSSKADSASVPQEIISIPSLKRDAVQPQPVMPPQRSVTPAPLPPRSSLFAPPAGLPLTAPPYLPPKSQYIPMLAPPRLDGSAPLPGFGGYNFQQRAPLMPAQNNTPFSFNPSLPPPPPPGPPPPPAKEEVLRQSVIFGNFDDEAIKSKDVQTQILFRQKMGKVRRSKNHSELCAITGLPARYRDPSTGLPYSSPWAFKEIQRLKRGEYKWSKLVGAYVGQGISAARGVPARFLSTGVGAGLPMGSGGDASNPTSLFHVSK